MNQESIFLNGEGDAWFERNRQKIVKTTKDDWPLLLIERNNLKPARVLELGCANGWRLAELRRQTDCLVGVDASRDAIESGQQLYPELELIHGSITEAPLDGVFDLIIVNFVLHWIDRSLLTRTIAEIDRLLGESGMLILGDFCPRSPLRREYHHLPSQNVWTWKQDYGRLFLALGIYCEIDSESYRHDKPVGAGGENESSTAACVLLQKSLSGNYVVEQ